MDAARKSRQAARASAPEPGRATLKDVAVLAGVSRSTASRILGGYGYASEDLRERVREAAEQLRYRPNRVAQATRSGRSGVFGFIGADVSNAVFGEMVRGVCDEVASGAHQVLVMNSDLDVDLERTMLESMVNYPVDGLIIAPGTADWSALLRIRENGTPVVVVDRMGVTRFEDLDCVSIDHVAAAERAFDYLARKGHRRIGMVSGVYSHDAHLLDHLQVASSEDVLHTVSPAGARIVGYWRALRRRFGTTIAPFVVSAPVRDNVLLELRLREALAAAETERPTALIVADVPSLAVLLGVTRNLGIDVPADVSIVTIGSLGWAEFMAPAMTVVHNPSYQIGRHAAALLSEVIEQGRTAPQQLVLNAPLIERGSVATLDELPDTPSVTERR